MSNPSLVKEATRAVDFFPLKVSSPSFLNDGFIPAKFTCDGINVNPPLNIEHIPEDAKCLAMIVDDPDAPAGNWVHWLVWNIPVTHHIKENEIHGIEGFNDFHQHHYAGPCPPEGTHHYFFKIYALNALLNLPLNTRKLQLEKAMSEHIIAFGELVGLYTRNT
ncbi:YbhB/YbcL family Raf kinase inhibitor-like protein [Daejeonella oryzae]|uniref:YbhB/YbcL family Raf kinase inhibitor-like protein n=1 Tax=Daejeonella oryzae TaxID=1122943 RepID=UPI00040CC039|nr:YbhB/YbcL family Raf kinase inhibitor-like protein [Daejeonella oryzae]